PVPYTQPRRLMCGSVARLNIPGMLRAFDFASVDQSSPQRHQTTVPQQALFLMNSPFLLDQARGLAKRAADAPDRVRSLYRLALGGDRSDDERRLGEKFLDQPAPPPVV